jgi:hypothetical protein
LENNNPDLIREKTASLTEVVEHIDSSLHVSDTPEVGPAQNNQNAGTQPFTDDFVSGQTKEL